MPLLWREEWGRVRAEEELLLLLLEGQKVVDYHHQHQFLAMWLLESAGKLVRWIAFLIFIASPTAILPNM